MAKSMTADEKRHVSAVVALNCVVCRNENLGESPSEYHHVRYLGSAGKRAPNKAGIPLCPNHHRNGGKGIAYHASPKEFEFCYGTEAQLLEQTYNELGLEMSNEWRR